MPEKKLLANDYTYLLAAGGEYVTVNEAHTDSRITRKNSLFTPRDGLTSHARHILPASTATPVYVPWIGGATPYQSVSASTWKEANAARPRTTVSSWPGLDSVACQVTSPGAAASPWLW